MHFLHLTNFGNQILLSGSPLFNLWRTCTLSSSAARAFCLVHYFLTLFAFACCLKSKRRAASSAASLLHNHTLFFVFRVHLIHPTTSQQRIFSHTRAPSALYSLKFVIVITRLSQHFLSINASIFCIYFSVLCHTKYTLLPDIQIPCLS